MTRKKSVSFGFVVILEFPIILGENPSVNGGAPIEIGWELVDRSKREMRLYEFMRSSQRKHGRGKSLVLSAPERSKVLLDSGYSPQDIGDACIRVEKIQKQRRESLKHSTASALNDRMMTILETTGKIPRNMIRSMLKLGRLGGVSNTGSRSNVDYINDDGDDDDDDVRIKQKAARSA